MARITFRSVYAQYRKNPNIRMLVNLWYDGSPSELLLWESRHMLKRLVLRAIEEVRLDPDAARRVFREALESKYPSIVSDWEKIPDCWWNDHDSFSH